MSPYQKNTIRRLQRTTPLYKRPRGHMCPRHRRGGCPRGPECPYAVGMPTGDKEKDIWYRYVKQFLAFPLTCSHALTHT